MIKKFNHLLLLALGAATIISVDPAWAQSPKCSYGERGSLTATCENANARFFKATTYRFDMLDETLRCINCELDVVDANAFDISGNQIQILDLRKSNISQLKPKAFTGLVFMRTLVLAQNNIQELQAGVFTAIKKVITLDVSYNRITKIGSQAFKELGNMTTLSLDHNRIDSLASDAFDGLNELRTLTLDDNLLTEINFAGGLSKLRKLNVSHNVITALRQGDFENLTSLVSLDLSNNLVTELAKGTFHALKQLVTLDLSNNRIQHIEPFAFENLQRLEVLSLSFNRISVVERFAFTDLNNLRELGLASNSLDVMQSGRFTGMPELQFLNVSNNRIELFVGTGNVALASVHTLDLSYNNLTDIDYKIIFKHMPHISYLKLDHNPWACYLVTEIVQYTKYDNVKLSAEGILANTTCVQMRHTDVAAMVASKMSAVDADELPDRGYAHASIVYTLMSLMMVIIAFLAFAVYRLTMHGGGAGGRHSFGNAASHANLMSNDILANEG